jgi:parvulin-like peptidyl-prolyl isomerase
VDRAKPTADRLAAALAQGRSLEEAAKDAGITPFTVKDLTRAQPDPRLAMAPEVVGALFAATPGKIVGPVREPAGWYFARLDDKVVAPMDSTYDKTKGPLLSDILGARQRTFFNGWLEDLRMKTRVQDLRNVAAQ